MTDALRRTVEGVHKTLGKQEERHRAELEGVKKLEEQNAVEVAARRRYLANVKALGEELKRSGRLKAVGDGQQTISV